MSCALWVPELRFDRLSDGELFASGVPSAARHDRVCTLCGSADGVGTLRCRIAGCLVAYHSRCAVLDGYAMRARLSTSPAPCGVVLEHVCPKHSLHSLTNGADTAPNDTNAESGGDDGTLVLPLRRQLPPLVINTVRGTRRAGMLYSAGGTLGSLVDDALARSDVDALGLQAPAQRIDSLEALCDATLGTLNWSRDVVRRVAEHWAARRVRLGHPLLASLQVRRAGSFAPRTPPQLHFDRTNVTAAPLELRIALMHAREMRQFNRKRKKQQQ